MLKLIDYTSFFKNWSQSKVFKNQTTSIQESLWASSVHIFIVLEHMLFGVPNKVTLVKLFHTSNRYWRIISHMMYSIPHYAVSFCLLTTTTRKNTSFPIRQHCLAECRHNLQGTRPPQRSATSTRPLNSGQPPRGKLLFSFSPTTRLPRPWTKVTIKWQAHNPHIKSQNLNALLYIFP